MKYAVLFSLLLAACSADALEAPVVAGGASSLQSVLTAVSAAWQPSKGSSVTWSFEASSSLLRRQEAGAAFELMVLADEELARKACRSGVPKVLWANHIVLAARGAVLPLAALSDLVQRDGPIALAAAAVPAGAAARRVLLEAGVLDQVQARLVDAASVRGALALLQAGAAQWAFVYDTDVRGAAEVSAAWRSGADGPGRVLCSVVLTTDAPRASTLSLFEHLCSPSVRALATARGFLPVEQH